jgi:hypothetical protein
LALGGFGRGKRDRLNRRKLGCNDRGSLGFGRLDPEQLASREDAERGGPDPDPADHGEPEKA